MPALSLPCKMRLNSLSTATFTPGETERSWSINLNSAHFFSCLAPAPVGVISQRGSTPHSSLPHNCPHLPALLGLAALIVDGYALTLGGGKCLPGTRLSPVASESSSCSCPPCAPSAPPPSRRCSLRRLSATSPSPGSCRTCTSPATYESLLSVQDETLLEGPETHLPSSH